MKYEKKTGLAQSPMRAQIEWQRTKKYEVGRVGRKKEVGLRLLRDAQSRELDVAIYRLEE